MAIVVLSIGREEDAEASTSSNGRKLAGLLRTDQMRCTTELLQSAASLTKCWCTKAQLRPQNIGTAKHDALSDLTG